MKRRFILGLVAGTLSLSLLAGCAVDVTPVEDPTPTTSGSTTASTTTTETTTTPITSPTSSPGDPAKFNRLTGEYDNEAGPTSRPVAVMIGNNDRSRPQVGLSAADWFIEAETEGGITRIMAVFADVSRLPAQLCPIRSARTPFIKLARALDAVYVHAGGSIAGLELLDNISIDAMNALENHGGTFWRDEALRAQKGLEYSLSTSGSNLKNRLDELRMRTYTEMPYFTFSDEAVSGSPCTELQVTFSGAQSVRFVYNADTGLYTKHHAGRSGSYTLHTDAAGGTIDVANVIVMYDTKYTENEVTIGFTLSSGNGVICAGGKTREIAWQRTDSGLTFTENGQPATLLPGKTYICLVNKHNAGSTVIQ